MWQLSTAKHCTLMYLCKMVMNEVLECHFTDFMLIRHCLWHNPLFQYHCRHGCHPAVPDVAEKVALQYACSNDCVSCVAQICEAPGTAALTVSFPRKLTTNLKGCTHLCNA